MNVQGPDRERSRRWPVAAVVVAGDSMRPTLRAGDCLLVLRRGRIRPGDLVLTRRPDRPSLLVVKRVLAVESGGWWVEGDNPECSDDSRTFGPVSGADVRGRVVIRYWRAHR